MKKIISCLSALVLCLGMLTVAGIGAWAEGETTEASTDASTSQYASIDYANKSEDFTALMDAATGSTVEFPLPEAYVEGITTRMKYIVDGALIKEKYSDKTFLMHFCGADLTIDGSYLANIGGSRIEIQIQQSEPIAIQYTCPKCTSTPKANGNGNYNAFTGTLDKFTLADKDTSTYVCPRCAQSFTLAECGEPEHNELVKGAIQIIETDKHPVIGQYVLELNIYSDNRAVSDYGTKESGITCTIKASADALSAAKSVEKFDSFNVYAYKSQTSDYSNMEAVIDEAAGTATFRVQDRGWFYIAADKQGDVYRTFGQTIKSLLPVIIIAAVVVVGAIVALVVFLSKKKKGAASAEA